MENIRTGLNMTNEEIEKELALFKKNKDVKKINDSIDFDKYNIVTTQITGEVRKEPVENSRFHDLKNKAIALVLAAGVLVGGVAGISHMDKNIPQITNPSNQMVMEIGEYNIDTINEYCVNLSKDGVPRDEISNYLSWVYNGMHLTHGDIPAPNDALYYESLEYYNLLHELMENGKIDKKVFDKGIELSNSIQSVGTEFSDMELKGVTNDAEKLCGFLYESDLNNAQLVGATQGLLGGVIDKANGNGIDNVELHALNGSMEGLSDYYKEGGKTL